MRMTVLWNAHITSCVLMVPFLKAVHKKLYKGRLCKHVWISFSTFLAVLECSRDVYAYIQPHQPDDASRTLEWLPSIPRAYASRLSSQFVDIYKRTSGIARTLFKWQKHFEKKLFKQMCCCCCLSIAQKWYISDTLVQILTDYTKAFDIL